jgi:hypothetical protein
LLLLLLLLLLQEATVQAIQQRITNFWGAQAAVLQQQIPGMTLEDLKYARSLVRSVFFIHSQPCLAAATAKRQCCCRQLTNRFAGCSKNGPCLIP